MENVLTMTEAIGVNVRWDTNWMKLERSVLVSTRTRNLLVILNTFKNNRETTAYYA